MIFLGGRSEWMKGNWLKDMMNAYMNMNQKDELFKLSQNAPPRIKSDRKSEISRAFGSKNKKKQYGSPEKILKIFCIIEANGFSCFKSTYLAMQSAKFNHSCLPNAERTQFRKVNPANKKFVKILILASKFNRNKYNTVFP